MQSEFGIIMKRRGPVAVVAVFGELDIATVPALREAFEEVEEDDVAGVVADLSATEFCDSSGMNTLLRAYKRAQADGRAFGVVTPPDGGSVQRVMQLLGFDDVFGLYPSVDAAVEELTTGPS